MCSTAPPADRKQPCHHSTRDAAQYAAAACSHSPTACRNTRCRCSPGCGIRLHGEDVLLVVVGVGVSLWLPRPVGQRMDREHKAVYVISAAKGTGQAGPRQTVCDAYEYTN
jgi:hypothetical protein